MTLTRRMLRRKSRMRLTAKKGKKRREAGIERRLYRREEKPGEAWSFLRRSLFFSFALWQARTAGRELTRLPPCSQRKCAAEGRKGRGQAAVPAVVSG